MLCRRVCFFISEFFVDPIIVLLVFLKKKEEKKQEMDGFQIRAVTCTESGRCFPVQVPCTPPNYVAHGIGIVSTPGGTARVNSLPQLYPHQNCLAWCDQSR
jgi:hypothetical protein